MNALRKFSTGNYEWRITDLSPLSQLYRLRVLQWDNDLALTAFDFEALSRLSNIREFGFGFNNELSSLAFLRNHPRLQSILLGYANVTDFDPVGELEFLKNVSIYNQSHGQSIDVSFLRANRELLSFGTHMGIAGERVFLYLNKLKVFSTGWSGSPDQPHQFSEYTNLDFLMNAVELEQISVENYGLSDFLRLSSFANLKSLNINGNRISDLSVLTGLDQLESVSLVSNELQTLGDVLINWPALSNGNTFFNLSNNPLPCSEVDAARANPNITVEFDGQCGLLGIDAFKFDAPARPYAVYHYALDSAPFTYPYELNGDQYSVSDRGGWTGMTFSVEFNDQMQLFASPFDTEALNSAWQSGGGSTVMATEATGNRDTRKFRVSGGAKEAQIAIFTNFGLSAEDVVQTGHYLRVTRPTVGSAPWGDGADCAFPTLEGFSPQIEREKQIGLYFSDLIEGGSAPMFEHSLGENALLNCSDTPPGTYDLQVAALDGRGGKKLFNLTVEVLAEQTAGGKLEWLSKPSDGFLPCNDYCVQTADRLAYRFALSEASTASAGTTIVYGVEDFFDTSNGSEAAPVSDGLQAHLGDAALADLDDVSTNKSRAFSYDLSSLRGLITGAVLKIRARPLDDERAEGNDEIYLSGFDESGNNLMPAYTIGLGVDSPPNNYFDFDWQIDGRPAHPAEGYEIVINLANFAAKEGAGLSLIEEINTTGLLDMVVGDDTNVDYVSLEVSIGSAEAERFPFFQSMENVEAEFRGGWVGGAFEFKLNDQFKTFATTDSDGNYQSGDYFAQQSALFTTAIREGAGGISLRLTESGGVDNSFGLNNLEKETTLGLTTNVGNSVEQISVRNRYVRMTRLEPGSGSRADSQCTEYGIDEYADGIQHHGQSSLMPNNVISGGTMDLLGFGGENSFYLCSDTPAGIFPVVFQVLDGRGGKTQIELTIEVLEARTPQGKVEWFAYSPNAVDSDGDGVPDNIDAFPNDPAASVDTDGDGLPDRWNPGYFAEDSTSTPALIKDMDDDGDGVLDSVDQRPLDASEAFLTSMAMASVTMPIPMTMMMAIVM